MKFVIGVDVGGTKIIAAAANEAGEILALAQTETRAHEGAEAGVRRIIGMIEKAAGRAGLDPRQASAIGIGSPGPLDIQRGMILESPNLKWSNLPLRDLVAEHFGVPAALTNDCKAGGLGEHRYGAGRGTSEMIYLGVGTGIGGCIISGGKILYGATGNAGEVGHMVIEMDGPLCGCGGRGCLEAVASGSAISRAGREVAATPEGGRIRELAGGDPEQVHGGHVARAAAEGDPAAQAILDRAARGLGIGAANLMNALGPEVVVLGGGVMAKNGSAFLAKVEAAVREQVLPGCEAPLRMAELGEESVMRGAVALALDLSESA